MMTTQTLHKESAAAEPRKSDGRHQATPSLQGLIEGLNGDLAREYQAILMYNQYAALVSGPFRRELRELFRAEVTDELGHAQFLADKIAALGGEPTTCPLSVPKAHSPREMLQNALEGEKRTIDEYLRRIDEADKKRMVGLRVILENQVADETRHMEELELMLAGWDKMR